MPRTPTEPSPKPPSQAQPSRGAAAGAKVSPVARTPGRQAPADDGALPTQHEKDESSGNTGGQPSAVIEQAKRDIDAGLVDTDMRATPGLDAQRRQELVPGPGGQPPQK